MMPNYGWSAVLTKINAPPAQAEQEALENVQRCTQLACPK
jgi:hypothetical protein